jgi:hypothetical protein
MAVKRKPGVWSLDDLRELSDAADALKTAYDEALVMRNTVILGLYKQGHPITSIARTARVDRTWPYTLVKTHRGDKWRWRRKHPNPAGVLNNALQRLSALLELLEWMDPAEDVPEAEFSDEFSSE